jgi:hypothetical protein
MPLSSYTVIHHDAKLSSADKSEIEKWVKRLKNRLNKGLNHQYYSVMTKTFSKFNTTSISHELQYT